MDRVTKTNIKVYDKKIKDFIKNTFTLEESEMAIREEFMSYFKKGDSILDVACGAGRDAKIFSDNGLQVTGIDLSQNFIEHAKKYCPTAEFKLMDIKKITFPKNSFQGIHFNAGLIMIEKRYASSILTGLFQILKKDGVMIISVKEGKTEGFEIDSRYNTKMFYAYYQEKELKELLQKAGFTYIKTIRPVLKSAYAKHPWINILCKK